MKASLDHRKPCLKKYIFAHQIVFCISLFSNPVPVGLGISLSSLDPWRFIRKHPVKWEKCNWKHCSTNKCLSYVRTARRSAYWMQKMNPHGHETPDSNRYGPSKEISLVLDVNKREKRRVNCHLRSTRTQHFTGAGHYEEEKWNIYIQVLFLGR